jgi:hypothetical protein
VADRRRAQLVGHAAGLHPGRVGAPQVVGGHVGNAGALARARERLAELRPR